MKKKQKYLSFIGIWLSVLFWPVSGFSQKVEWMYASGQRSSGTIQGIQVLHTRGGHIIFNDYIMDTPLIYQGVHISIPLVGPTNDFDFFLPYYDSLGHFLSYGLTSRRSSYSGQNPWKMVGPENGSFYFCNTGGNIYGKGDSLRFLDSLGNMVQQKILDSIPQGAQSSCLVLDEAIGDSDNVYFAFLCEGSFTILGRNFNYPIDSYRVMIVKADSACNMIWCMQLAGGTDLNFYRFFINLYPDHSGNLLFTGTTPTETIAGKPYKPSGNGDFFIGKLQGSDGAIAWCKEYDGDFLYTPNSFVTPAAASCIDDSANFYITFSFLGNASFGTLKLSSPSNYSPALLKFDSAGNVIWARQVNHFTPNKKLNWEDSVFWGISVKADPEGNIYTCGPFDGGIIIGKDSAYAGSSAYTSALYLIKYNNAGALQWNKTIKYNPKENKNSQAYIWDVMPDNLGNVYFTGYFSDTVKMDTFKLYTKAEAAMNGKISFAILPVFKDSITYTHDCDSLPFYFDFYSRGTIDSVVWNFGDGTQSDSLFPMHSYSKAGTYIVTVKVYSGVYDTIISETVNYIAFPSRLLPRDTILCTNASLYVTCSVPSATNYLWNNGDTVPIRTLNQAGFYKITVSGFGCSKSDSFNFSHDLRSFSLGNDTTLCIGNSKTLTGPSWQNIVYKWNTGSTSQSITVSSPGTYKLQVNDSSCIFSDSILIKYNSPPSFYLPSDTVICPERPIQFTVKNFLGSILWQDGNTDSNYTITTAGTYTVTLKNICGTKTYTSVVADSNCECYLFVPNIFTPNQDHINDLFYAQSACEPLTYTLQVYNRWGERVFQSNDINTGWDGTFKNLTCPEGVYIYKIIYKFPNATEQIKSGTVTVGR